MSEIGLKPEGVRVILLPDPVEEVTKGGIIIKAEETKDNEKMQNVKGTIVAIGPRADTETIDGMLMVGDRVLYAKHSGIMVDGEDGVEYRLANDEDIFAKIN
jgi:co-chaperonin GroES (HSP10)